MYVRNRALYEPTQFTMRRRIHCAQTIFLNNKSVLSGLLNRGLTDPIKPYSIHIRTCPCIYYTRAQTRVKQKQMHVLFITDLKYTHIYPKYGYITRARQITASFR